MFDKSMTIDGFDPQVASAIKSEMKRQEEHIELIASENYASPRVMQAQGCIMTNKYAEGYPQHRYYGGCEFMDTVEQVAIDRLKQLYAADYANVQPHSGSQANAAVFLALCQAGDTVLGMSLSDGGHLTHGSKVNFSGRIYNAIQYGVDNNGLLNYDNIEELALRHKPRMIISGFSAYSQIVDWERMENIAKKVQAYLMVDMAHVSGLVATGEYPNPIPFCDVVTSTTHKTLRGPRGGFIVCRANLEIEKKLNSAVFPGTQGGPLMHAIAAKAVAFLEALQPDFVDYIKMVKSNAKVMARTLSERGFDVVSGDTENHLMLVSLISKGITGKAADAALGRAHITVNKNTVPNDPQSPFVTSGLRLGTPAITTRGLDNTETEHLSHLVCDVLDDVENEECIKKTRLQVVELCLKHPVYGIYPSAGH